MNKDEYFQFHADFCQRMQDVTRAKNHDYTGDSEDPFANFTLAERLGACSTEQGFVVRISDKLSRIASLIDKTAQVKDESIADTLHDLANYCALFAGYLESKRSKQVDDDDHLTHVMLSAETYARFAAEEFSISSPVEKYYEIVASSRSGDIVIESCPDPILAVNRLDALREEWPTFKLRIVECETAYEDEDEHSRTAG